MSTLEELYRTLLKSAVTGNGVPDPEGADPGELDCLLHPEAHPPIFLAAAVAVLIWVILNKTTFGYELTDITANRAGIICLDKPGMFISVITGLYNKGYIDFYWHS